ncbi:MAG: antitermination protein NusG [Chloroflexi bacterium]|nr:antitermination protein NusG [Chloroflexota bacterium]
MEIFTQGGYAFLARWLHFLAGIMWIGLLYYFNFVQVPAFVEMGAQARSEALQKITWRALWWFRWGAALTLLTGLLILGFNEQFTRDYFTSPAGTSIATAAILGIVMFSNVWLVIWPAQRIVIGSARRVSEGGEADPGAPAAARRALLASRANTLFSIPLLFFMGATSHLAGSSHFVAQASNDSLLAYWVIFVVVAGAIELDALGRFAGYAPGWTKAPFDSIRGALITGLVLLVIFYLVFELLFQA